MGSYSVCKRCVHKATDAEYAVKVRAGRRARGCTCRPGAGTSGFANALSRLCPGSDAGTSVCLDSSYFANPECVLLQSTGRQVLSPFSNFT